MGTQPYTKQFINQNFLIKVYGVVDGIRINTLMGVRGAFSLLGDLFYRLVARAWKHFGEKGKTVCKLRRGMKITFYEK